MKRWIQFIALGLALAAPRLQAATPLDLMLGQQTWQTLQGELQLRVDGAGDKVLKAPYFRSANGDFAVRASADEFQFVKQGLYTRRYPGQVGPETRPLGAGSLFVAMLRLAFAGTAERAHLDLVAAEGQSLQVRWNDWHSAPLLTATLDEHSRILSISAAEGKALMDKVAYNVSGGKIYVSSWRLQRQGLRGGLSGSEAGELTFNYALESVAVDQPIPPDAFKLP